MEPSRDFVRHRARLALRLPIRIICRESADYEWAERSRLIDVNQFGAGFTLTRPVEVGRLIHLTLPLPHTLRCFDQFEPMYSVWGLVRHVSSITRADIQSSALFRVGVAFVGKQPPLSYEQDPTNRYEPLPAESQQSSLWKLGRIPSKTQRRESRLIVPLEVLVEALDEGGKPSMQEYTVTETISSLGACIPTNLEVGVGRILRISSVTDGISVFAAIRSREVGPDRIARLGLEFIGERWPLGRDAAYSFSH